MPRKTTKPDDDEFDDLPKEDVSAPEAEMIEQRDIKINSMIASMKGRDNYVVQVYKRGSNGKRDWLVDYEGEVPGLGELRNRFGAGRYDLYIKDTDTNKLINSATVNIGELPSTPASVRPVVSEDDMEERFMKKMMMYKTMFGGESKNDSTDTIATMMIQMQQMNAETLRAMQNAQAESSKQLMTLIAETKNSSLEAQLQSERRFTEMIKELGGKNTDIKEMIELVTKGQQKASSGFGEMMQMLEFMRMVKEEVNPVQHESLIEKYLPSALPLLEKFITPSEATAPVQQAPQIPYTPPVAVRKQTIPPEFQLSNYPESFRETLALETKEEKKKMLIEKLGKSEEQAEKIITVLLKQKGISA